MEYTSVFEMLKIGIGPSSSHTLGPWRAARAFARDLLRRGKLGDLTGVSVHFYGSLALTGRGHGSDIAVMMGLSGADPVTVPLEQVRELPEEVAANGAIVVDDRRSVPFDPEINIHYHMDERLPFHANGMLFVAEGVDAEELLRSTYYSIGGGFILGDGDSESEEVPREVPWSIESGEEILFHCETNGALISDIVRQNELALRDEGELRHGLREIWRVMKEAVYRGVTRDGALPGGLEVDRRAKRIVERVAGKVDPAGADSWITQLGALTTDFPKTLKLISAFAIAVNEENAAFGRIVTSPTNGSSGVIPAVLMYYICFSRAEVGAEEIEDFLLVASIVGSMFRRRATISAAMGGCQAEIGVSSAMAAAALAEGLGGTPRQALMAAEIAMEHHLGMTCDPVAGLVQIPCIERNSMGAVKAIAAASLALESDPYRAKVSFDEVVRAMWATAQDMDVRYKETSQGGLAVNVSVRVPEC